VIAFDDGDFRPHRRQELSLSLTFAFLLSSRLRFHFPMSGEVSREVDRAFDQVLKDWPMESKGVAYEKDIRSDRQTSLLEGAKLVITSDLQIQKRLDASSIPNIFLDFKSDRTLMIKWRFLENLEDNKLKQEIIVYSKLIKAVSLIIHKGGRLEVDAMEQFSTHFGGIIQKEDHEMIAATVSQPRF
jgi:hypothetical protein